MDQAGVGTEAQGVILSLNGFQLRVAKLLGKTTGDLGFALGGGQALQLHLDGYSRYSNDLDAYNNRFNPALYDDAVSALLDCFTAEGLSASEDMREHNDVFRALDVTDPATGDSTRIDLGYDNREFPTVAINGVGPILSANDVVDGKVRALMTRGAERDFVDIHRILNDGRWSFDDIVATARKVVSPDTSPSDVHARMKQMLTGNLSEYHKLGLTDDDVNRVDKYLHQSARCDVCGRPLTSPSSVNRGRGPKCASGS